MNKNKTTRGITLPDVKSPENEIKITLPFNGSCASEESFLFSFACFDREHDLFNLGDNTKKDGIVESSWFLELLDCLKSISNFKICDLKNSKHDLHPVDWDKTNANPPSGWEQMDYQQLRLDKSSGRIIGIKLENIFYVMWLDRHHNLSDSDGYVKATYHTRPKSTYEKNIETIQSQKEEIERLKKELEIADQLMAQACK